MKNDKFAAVNSNNAIKRAIQKIALHGIVSGNNSSLKNTQKTVGYVVKIHTEGELAGTVDVQEYNKLYDRENGGVIGYHEGVLLSAIQNNEKGVYQIPRLYSDVVFVTDPDTLNEYIIMYSQVDTINLVSQEEIKIGVTELEEFNLNDPDSPDIDELPDTGVYTQTKYTKDKVAIQVKGKEDSELVLCEITKDQVTLNIHDSISITATKDKVVFNDGSFEGLIKINELTNKLNELVNAFNQHTHSISGSFTGTVNNLPATGTVTGTTQSPSSQAANFNKSDYENTKVVHG